MKNSVFPGNLSISLIRCQYMGGAGGWGRGGTSPRRQGDRLLLSLNRSSYSSATSLLSPLILHTRSWLAFHRLQRRSKKKKTFDVWAINFQVAQLCHGRMFDKWCTQQHCSSENCFFLLFFHSIFFFPCAHVDVVVVRDILRPWLSRKSYPARFSIWE